MKTRYLALSVGILLAAAAGTASAHDRGYYPPPPPRVGGSVTLWGGSHGVSGWSGALSLGVPVVLGPAYGPVLAVPAHRHGSRYHHGPGRGYAKAYRKGYVKGYSRGHRHGGRHDRDDWDDWDDWDD